LIFGIPGQIGLGINMDRALLEVRALVYERAREENPQRGSRQARQSAHVDAVHLKPDTPHIKEPLQTQKAA